MGRGSPSIYIKLHQISRERQSCKVPRPGTKIAPDIKRRKTIPDIKRGRVARFQKMEYKVHGPGRAARFRYIKHP